MNKIQSVAESLTALQSGLLEEAVAISCEYSGKEGSLYERDTVSIVQTILEHDYTPDPRLKEHVLTPLRVVAAAIELWGSEEVIPYAEVTGDWHYRYSLSTTLELLYSAGLEKHRLNGLAAMGIRQVKVSFPSGTSPCVACQAIAHQSFAITEAPAIPLNSCLSNSPCPGHYCAVLADAPPLVA